MKILIDAQISPHLALWFQDELKIEAYSLKFFNLQYSRDIEIYEFAKNNNFVILSKDSDFIDLLLRLGSPPKLIYLNTGNSSNDFLKELFRNKIQVILELLEENSIVELN